MNLVLTNEQAKYLAQILDDRMSDIGDSMMEPDDDYMQALEQIMGMLEHPSIYQHILDSITGRLVDSGHGDIDISNVVNDYIDEATDEEVEAMVADADKSCWDSWNTDEDNKEWWGNKREYIKTMIYPYISVGITNYAD